MRGSRFRRDGPSRRCAWLAAVASAYLVAPFAVHAQSGLPFWNRPGGGVSGVVHSLTTFDDGSGPALYIGGAMRWYGANTNNWIGLLRWNGHTLDVIQDGPTYIQGAFFVLDEGNGPSLFGWGLRPSDDTWTGRWTGSGWTPVTPGLYGPGAGAAPQVTVYEKHGPVIYGLRGNSSGSNSVMRWNGAAWTEIGIAASGGGTSFIYDMIAYRDGPRENLYICGGFTTINGATAYGVARWDGTSWSAPTGPNRWITAYAACVADVGTGPELYVAGDVYFGPPWNGSSGICRWNGQRWEDIVGGPSGPPSSPFAIKTMTQFNDGSGPALCVGGAFESIGGITARNIAKWNGTSWSPLGAGIGAWVEQMAILNDPRGPSLFSGGSFITVGNALGGMQSPGLAQFVSCPGPAYSDCDLYGGRNANDFMCFINKYANRDPYADCNVDGFLNAADFGCFIQKFAQ